MSAFVNSIFKPDLHEAPQKRQKRNRGDDLIQVAVRNFSMDQSLFFKGTNRSRGAAKTVQRHKKEEVDGVMNSGSRELPAKMTKEEKLNGKAEACLGEADDQKGQVQEEALLQDVETAKLMYDVLRLRGGGKENSSSDDEDHKTDNLPSQNRICAGVSSGDNKGPNEEIADKDRCPENIVVSDSDSGEEEEEERPDSWKFWELDKICLRPPPLDPPRRPDMAYVNMTVNGAENEDGMEHFSLAKDRYRRTDAQVDAVREARRDQRRFGGGIYQCIENGKTNLFLHIRKGSTKFVIITLLHVEQNRKPVIQFETFAKMNYESYTTSDGVRNRKNLPEETETGFIWYGHGGNTNPLASSVYTFCERVDNDVHFSVGPCERITQAPGASQTLCSSEQCGIVYWHFAVKFFERLGKQDYQEAGQEDFALIEFKSGDRPQELLWTDKDKVRTSWRKFESVPEQESKTISKECMKRVEFVIKEGLLPPSSFPSPCYSPFIESWQELEPMRRIPTSSPW